MGRRLTFESVVNSFDGELLLTEVNVVISPYEAYVQVTPDGAICYVDLPDAVPDAIDPLVGQTVSSHINSQLQEYRDEALEALRIMGRMTEQLRGLDLLIARYRKSSEYNDTYADRILAQLTRLIRDVIKLIEIRSD